MHMLLNLMRKGGEQMSRTLMVANSILKRAFQDNVSISPMKLQKLVYFVYKKYLQDTGYALFDERFEVWQYGPVLPSLYHAFKPYAANAIESYAVNEEGKVYTVDDKHKDFYNALSFVRDKYWYYSGMRLSELTHSDNSAWSKADSRGELYILDDEIKIEGWA